MLNTVTPSPRKLADGKSFLSSCGLLYVLAFTR
jgi:hypothetical protein